MKKIYSGIVIGLLFSIAGIVLALCSGALANDGPLIQVVTPSEVHEGDDFTVTVEASDLVNFDAGQFDVYFDDSILRMDNITNGQVGDDEIPVTAWNELEPGRCRVVMNVNGLPGINGSGSLAVFHFHVRGNAGSDSVISLAYEFINDNQAQKMEATWEDGRVSVVSNNNYVINGIGVGLSLFVLAAIILMHFLNIKVNINRERSES